MLKCHDLSSSTFKFAGEKIWTTEHVSVHRSSPYTAPGLATREWGIPANVETECWRCSWHGWESTWNSIQQEWTISSLYIHAVVFSVHDLSRVLCVLYVTGFMQWYAMRGPNHRYLGSREARSKASHTLDDKKGDLPNTFLKGLRRSSGRWESYQNVTNTAIEIRRSISSAEIRVCSGNSESKVSKLWPSIN